MDEKSLIKNIQSIQEIISSSFSILVYKTKKVNLDDILRLVIELGKKDIKQIISVLEKNLDIFFLYLSKGKDIEKVFFSFKKILLSNPKLLAFGLREIMK